MVRDYKRKPGSWRYADYTLQQLDECLESIKNGTFSHRKAAEHFNIPRRTILNKWFYKTSSPNDRTICCQHKTK